MGINEAADQIQKTMEDITENMKLDFKTRLTPKGERHRIKYKNQKMGKFFKPR